MSTEQQLVAVVSAANRLTNTVENKLGEIDKALADAREKYGDNSAQAADALQQYKQGLKKVDELNTQSAEVSKKIAESYK